MGWWHLEVDGVHLAEGVETNDGGMLGEAGAEGLQTGVELAGAGHPSAGVPDC